MIRGLPASIAFHAALIAGGSFAWPYIAPERTVEVLVPVTIDMQLDTETNFAPIVRREIKPEEPEPEPEEPAVEEVEEEEPDAEDVEIAEDELDTTDVRELPKESQREESAEIAEDADEEKAPEEKEEKEVAAKVREPDELEDILGDASDLFSEVKQRERKPVVKRQKKILVDESKVEAPRKGVGDRSKETARVEALIYSQMIECWETVLDQPNYERLQVTVSFDLNKNGSLDGDVNLISPRRAPIGDRPMQVAVERALRAVRKCSPYRLHSDALVSYDEWRHVTLDIGH